MEIHSKFYIYLVEESRYKKDRKPFPPGSHFFEMHGNTIDFPAYSSDFIEAENYFQLDNDVSRTFERLRLKENLEPAEMGKLLYFVFHLYWRNPRRDEICKWYLQKHGMKAIGLVIKDKQGKIVEQAQLDEEIRSNSTIYRLVKYLMPVAFFKKTLECNSELIILDFIPGGIPSVICDDPLILRNPESLDIFQDDFILPISRDKILIRSKKIRKQYQNRDKVYVDLILIEQARKYATSTDLNYIPELKKLMGHFTSESLRSHLFSCFTE